MCVCVYVCMYVCIYVCMYVCVYLYIYIYIYIYNYKGVFVSALLCVGIDYDNNCYILVAVTSNNNI